ncbi:hypothetical protein RIR_jg32482.t1 [Rhizophagus irregularis DAOM 181602=DAOM 197198]|nr:hypothetical protein RIR_jg32482.t1 [Rhizophagus irregularis DAOM 181602=DAOM 197198]
MIIYDDRSKCQSNICKSLYLKSIRWVRGLVIGLLTYLYVVFSEQVSSRIAASLMPEAPECSRCGLFLTAGPAGAADLLVSKFHDPKSYTIILLRI